MGLLLVCLVFHLFIHAHRNPLRISYLDDWILGGPADVGSADIALYKTNCATKFETIIINGFTTTNYILRQFIQLTLTFANFLGALRRIGPAMDACLSKRCADQERFVFRLELITAHDALVLLRTSFSALSQHTLHASPCYGHKTLLKFDQLLRDAL